MQCPRQIGLRLRGLSPFQRRVYGALTSVPAGSVVSYGVLGRVIGCGCPQAVGCALRTNPLAPRVPCHRVVCADGRIGGFNGCRKGGAVARKRDLLAREGVVFDSRGRLCNPALLMTVKDFRKD